MKLGTNICPARFSLEKIFRNTRSEVYEAAKIEESRTDGRYYETMCDHIYAL